MMMMMRMKRRRKAKIRYKIKIFFKKEFKIEASDAAAHCSMFNVQCSKDFNLNISQPNLGFKTFKSH